MSRHSPDELWNGVDDSILLGYTEAIRRRPHGFRCWSRPGCVTDDAFWLTWNATNCYHSRRSLVIWEMSAQERRRSAARGRPGRDRQPGPL